MYSSFEQFLIVSRGLQKVTIDGYVGSVKRMKKVLGENPTHEKIISYIQVFYSSEYSYAHKTNTALALERWTEYKGYPIKFSRQKKPRQIIKNTLTESEITKLIFNARTKRDKALISLLAYSGIRNLEVCNLKVDDFDAGKNTIRVIKGKGLKDGVCMISAECTKILLDYIQEYKLTPQNYLFYTYQKNQMTTGAVRKQVHAAARDAKIAKRVYPHLLRHSLASNMLLRGAHVIALQKQLRHSLCETTLMYLNSIVFGSVNEYDKFVPSYL